MQNRREFLLRVSGFLSAAVCGVSQAVTGRRDGRINKDLVAADDKAFLRADSRYVALSIPVFGRIPEVVIFGEPRRVFFAKSCDESRHNHLGGA